MSEIQELLRLVDELTDHLQRKRELMKEMARCVREGRLNDLEELLQRQGRIEEEGLALNRAREEMCARVASVSGMSPDGVTLKNLVDSLDGKMALAVNARRERLLAALQALLAESATTAHLVRFALDFNNKLMAILTGVDTEGSTYSSDGELQSLSDDRSLAGKGAANSTFEHSV